MYYATFLHLFLFLVDFARLIENHLVSEFTEVNDRGTGYALLYHLPQYPCTISIPSSVLAFKFHLKHAPKLPTPGSFCSPHPPNTTPTCTNFTQLETFGVFLQIDNYSLRVHNVGFICKTGKEGTHGCTCPQPFCTWWPRHRRQWSALRPNSHPSPPYSTATSSANHSKLDR